MDNSINQFDKVVEERLESVRQVMLVKGKEYRRKGNAYHNFDRAGAMLGCSRERGLIGMAAKHFVSVLDIVDDVEKGKLPSLETINEKIGDAVNYLILLEGALKDRNHGNTGNKEG